MKLAEALLLRGDIQKRLQLLAERVRSNAVVQQGDKPAENPEKLLRECAGLQKELATLVVRINRTNMKAKLADGRNLMEAVAERDRLKQQHALLLSAAGALKRDPDRYGTREIKWVPQLDGAKLQKQADDVSKTIRELNVRIQEANWKHATEE
ncbi:hypothetical protein PHYC_02838 [Phycisphaerales bacterium]|nr:hypothetical protein PHYC_02838 [Phycisphaerales bacterium]